MSRLPLSRAVFQAPLRQRQGLRPASRRRRSASIPRRRAHSFPVALATAASASEASPARPPTRASRVARSAVRNRPWNFTPSARAIAVTASRSAGVANTASITAECPARVARRALSASARVNARGDLRRIGAGGQPVGFSGAEQGLALDVGAQHHGAGRGQEVRRKRAGEHRFAGAGEPADGDQPRRRRCDQRRGKLEIRLC